MKHLLHYLALTGATAISTVPVLGQITVANSAQNYAGSLAQDVQGYLAGLPAGDEQVALDALFPGIQVNDFFQFAKADDEGFLTEADDSDIRGIGASFKRVQYRGTLVTASTIQKGLTMRVDHKTLPKVGGVIVPGWENRFADALRNRLTRVDRVRGLSVLDGAATSGGNKTFSGATNPDGYLRAMVQLTRVANGSMPTHCVLGNAAQQLRCDAYEDATRVNHAMANHADYSMAELAAYLGVGKVVLEDGIKQTAKAATKADVLGLAAYSYTSNDSPLMDDPSNIRRAWSPVLGGGEWGVAIQEAAVYTDITVWHESLFFTPFTAGIRKIVPA
jgi:hypothetical protein